MRLEKKCPYGYGSSDLKLLRQLYIRTRDSAAVGAPTSQATAGTPLPMERGSGTPGIRLYLGVIVSMGMGTVSIRKAGISRSRLGGCWQPGLWTQWVPVPRFGRQPLGWKPPVFPRRGGRGRVPRIHEAPVAGSPEPRFWRSISANRAREGADGSTVLPTQRARGEAGLGVPRGRIDLGNLAAPPTPGFPRLH